jgi:hypothetical protein
MLAWRWSSNIEICCHNKILIFINCCCVLTLSLKHFVSPLEFKHNRMSLIKIKLWWSCWSLGELWWNLTLCGCHQYNLRHRYPTHCNLKWVSYTGYFIMFSIITNIYNKKTKGPTLMVLFTATGKLKKFFFWQLEMFDMCTTGDTAHIDTIIKFLPHKCQRGCIDILHCCNDLSLGSTSTSHQCNVTSLT